jgi:hypothetical protein
MRKLNWPLIGVIFFCLIFWSLVAMCFAAPITEQRYVQIRFTQVVNINNQDISYSDCLYYKEGQVPSQDVIIQAENDRVANWVAQIKNPPVQVPLTKEQLTQQASDIDAQIQSLQSQKADTLTAISAIKGAIN